MARNAATVQLFLCVLVSCSRLPDPDSAEVVKVTDGDTFVVSIAGKNETIRLIGIDAPESRRNEKARRDMERSGPDLETMVSMGKQSKEFLTNLLRPGLSVRLEFDVRSKDKYGRFLCYVFLSDGKMLNEEIVRSGFAFASSYPPNIKYQEALQKAQHEAEESNVGLWRLTR